MKKQPLRTIVFMFSIPCVGASILVFLRIVTAVLVVVIVVIVAACVVRSDSVVVVALVSVPLSVTAATAAASYPRTAVFAVCIT